MTLEMTCPVCHAAFIPPDDAPAYPPDGSVAVCVTCADIVVWNHTTGGETPTPEYKAELLQLQPVIDSLMEIRQWHDQRAKDRQDLCTLISYGLMAGLTVPDIVETLIEDGFHRHPDEPTPTEDTESQR